MSTKLLNNKTHLKKCESCISDLLSSSLYSEPIISSPFPLLSVLRAPSEAREISRLKRALLYSGFVCGSGIALSPSAVVRRNVSSVSETNEDNGCWASVAFPIFSIDPDYSSLPYNNDPTYVPFEKLSLFYVCVSLSFSNPSFTIFPDRYETDYPPFKSDLNYIPVIGLCGWKCPDSSSAYSKHAK